MNQRNCQLAVLISVLAIALAACSDQEPGANKGSFADTGTTKRHGAAETTQPAPRLNIPFDHVVLKKSGVFAGEDSTTGDSAVTIEFLTGTVEEVTQSITNSLREQGFRLSESEPARGGERHTFRRAAGERLSVLIRPKGEVELVTKGATGSLYASWRR